MSESNKQRKARLAREASAKSSSEKNTPKKVEVEETTDAKVKQSNDGVSTAGDKPNTETDANLENGDGTEDNTSDKPKVETDATNSGDKTVDELENGAGTEDANDNQEGGVNSSTKEEIIEEDTGAISPSERRAKYLDDALERFTSDMPSTATTTIDQKNYAQQSLSSSMVSALSNCEDEEFANIWEHILSTMESDKSGAFQPEIIMSAFTDVSGNPVVEEHHQYMLNIFLTHMEKGKDKVSEFVDLSRMMEVIPSPIGSRVNAYYSN